MATIGFELLVLIALLVLLRLWLVVYTALSFNRLERRVENIIRE